MGAGDIAHAQIWRSAVESLPASALRSSVLGYLSTASGQEQTAAAQLERAWELSDPAADPDGAASVAQRLVLHSLGAWDGPGVIHWARTAASLAGPLPPLEAMALLHRLGHAVAGLPNPWYGLALMTGGIIALILVIGILNGLIRAILLLSGWLRDAWV